MQNFARTFVGNLALFTLLGVAGPILLVCGALGVADAGGGERGVPLAFLLTGLVCTLAIAVAAFRFTRKHFRVITDRDRVSTAFHCDDHTFVLWTPRARIPIQGGRLAVAEVREATFVSYGEDWEATYQEYGSDADPDEPKPRIRLRLRVHPDGGEPFESTQTWRVPSLCLAAVTAGRLAAVVHPDVPEEFGIDWPRSALLSGVPTCGLLGLDGRYAALTGRPDLLLELCRITGTGAAGRIAMDGDTIDLRRADPAVARRLQGLVERAAGGWPTPEPVPDGRARWVVDLLAGEKGAFGGVDRRWARRGGHLIRGRLLQLRGTTTFQYAGPVLETVLRLFPADGTRPIDVGKKLTVPMTYLALLHRTKQLVVRVGPDGRSYEIDWERSALAAGVSPAVVVGPDGRRFDLTGRFDALLDIMRLLVTGRVSVPGPVLDLRDRRTATVAAQVMDVVRAGPDRSARLGFPAS
ncbi:hypothetical protein DER29_6449 [Micromonospora sp. M71_S20]|uniref:hypothetical protein n=1 Tax=Micromonospora sp. M71_S20 TaxID=592872 RepID=UPI000EB1981C|nr:hypothetical protein [Micromonospora sp. M71_S20]RLK09887.1 hypothetical protein DER29_6449 [Micromonospora sp. M71_S20]